MSRNSTEATQGAENLLRSCADIGPGMRVLFVNEDTPSVDKEVVAFLEQMARDLGADVSSVWPPRASSPEAISAELMDAMDAADCVIFNHQLGPMLRLRQPKGSGTKVLNYATTWDLLSSPCARVPHPMWHQVMEEFGSRMARASEWRIQCPLGTDVSGRFVPAKGPSSAQPFTLITFPMDTHSPRPMTGANGRLALRWLVTSAMHDLGSEGIQLSEPVMGVVEEDRLVRFEGNPQQCARAREFLEGIGAKFGKDPFRLNSWHAGVNPQTRVAYTAEQSLEQWMLLAHASPRILHFHVVGEKMPGEISAAVLDPTVTVDGRVWWDRGHLKVLDDPEFFTLAATHPDHRPFELHSEIGA